MKILIWEVRTKLGLTLIDLEKMTGINKSSLNNYENGKTSPNLIQLEKIAKALNVKMNELFESEYK